MSNYNIPVIDVPEGLKDLITDGYNFIKNNTEQHRCDILELNFMGQKVVCLSGEEGARLFYDSERFQRYGAVPMRVQKTLFGVNAVHTMDGQGHIHRKQLFLSLMRKKEKKVAQLVMKNWESRIDRWATSKNVVLFDEAKDVLCSAACQWAGIELPESEVKKRADELIAMVDALGGLGPRYYVGKLARIKTEKWLGGIIDDVRNGRLKPEENTALFKIAFFKELDGKELSSQMAAVELLNIIRPMVAISLLVTFTALAIHKHPEHKEKLLLDSSFREMFVQEVRRYYPFVPVLGARSRKGFTWKGCEFKEKMLVILDVYGINHDPRIWDDPDKFNPRRFEDFDSSLYNFIPQGGGDPTKTHRCPAEPITIEVLKNTLDFLANKITYDVPDQNLSYSLKRAPSLPQSGFIISNVKWR
ncbi:cytochrome P450 [Proteinivorax hydrogeniformans]|uniref:Cytochrome P450 n=1 Tax=Proteinivorax hydrogeniformans TaxID=1826727 RepID=A0AAU8HRQ4_9FIRM